MFADLDALANELRVIFRCQSGVEDDPVTALQTRYGAALVLIAKFIERSGIGADIAEHFARLASAILDLKDGREQAEFLKPKTVKYRAPLATDLWAVRAYAVCAVEWFKRSGLRLPEAYARVAQKRDLARAQDRGRRVGSLKSSLKTWRDAIRMGRADPVACRIWQQNNAHIEISKELRWSPQQVEVRGADILKTAAAEAQKLNR